MDATSGYEQAWESFWQDAPDGPGAVFWDAAPAVTAARHLPYFENAFDPGLPLVDLGCGNGTQTRFLAGRYDRVIGVDIAPAAVARAGRADPRGVAAYRLLDAADPAATGRLHDELGDVNVYMRGVLHQCEPADRAALVEGIATLAGERGRVFAVELAEAAKGVLLGLAQGPAGPPAKLGAVFAHGIAPGEVSDVAVTGYFRDAGLPPAVQGELPLVTTEFTATGDILELPSKWLLAAPVDAPIEV